MVGYGSGCGSGGVVGMLMVGMVVVVYGSGCGRGWEMVVVG